MSDVLQAPSRRQLLLGSGALFAWAYMPRQAQAAGRDPRLLVIVLRGALDGLATAAPIGDPDWAKLRGEDALRFDRATPALRLDGFFGLNPAMPNFHRLFQKKEALVVHACAGAYRDRSHFDGQDVLESGMTKPGVSETGWLNRALAAMTPGDRANPGQAFAVGPTTPLIVRGSAKVLSWTPAAGRKPGDDTLMRLLDVYRHTDVELARALEERLGIAALAQADGMAMGGPDRTAKGVAQVRENFAHVGRTAARFMSRSDGPRIGALSMTGWDTHANEGALDGRLSVLLGALDATFQAIEAESGPAWKDMVVAVITEFGRTARLNGTQGTDHGTATTALLAGGAVKGGRVIADWPGLRPSDLHEGRDLRPTTDLRGVMKGLLKDHLGLEDRVLAETVFPDSRPVRPMQDLVA